VPALHLDQNPHQAKNKRQQWNEGGLFPPRLVPKISTVVKAYVPLRNACYKQRKNGFSLSSEEESEIN